MAQTTNANPATMTTVVQMMCQAPGSVASCSIMAILPRGRLR